MLYLKRWKATLILLLCAAGMAFSAPNLLSREAADSLPRWIPHEQVSLGLDLRGGSHLLLEIDAAAVIGERLERLQAAIRAALLAEGVGHRELRVADGAVFVELGDAARRERALRAIRALARPLGSGLTSGQDLVAESDGGARIVVRLTEAAVQDRVRAATEQSIEVVRRRIDQLGTREPVIQRQGQDRILVQLPGERDPDRVKRLLGETAKLSFRIAEPPAGVGEQAFAEPPEGFEVAHSDPRSGERHERWLLRRGVAIDGVALTDAQASFEHGQPVVSFRFDAAGAKRFAEVTRENVGRPFAILLDGKVVSAPIIREAVLGGVGVISGRFTVPEANDLALLLRAGALPAPLGIVEERTVGPALGSDSIRAGSIASIAGLALVVAFMVVAYGIFGVFAALGLAVNMVLIFGALSLLQATLTLPGLAGIVLTIGMAVDGNVLIFERVREEARIGRPVAAALEAGFARAAATIFDSNVTTLIAAALLFFLGSGPVKGFAVTLAIGILTSVFTAVLFTRLVLAAWVKQARPTALPI